MPKYLTMRFDVEGLTDPEIAALTGEVWAQAEGSEGHPSVEVEEIDETPSDGTPRIVLAHLNIEIDASAPCTVDDLVKEIEGALEVGIDPEHTPALALASVTVALAEEV